VYPISAPAAHVNLGAGMRCRQSRCMPMITLCADDHLIPTFLPLKMMMSALYL
jgi:hypothetical protein